MCEEKKVTHTHIVKQKERLKKNKKKFTAKVFTRELILSFCSIFQILEDKRFDYQ